MTDFLVSERYSSDSSELANGTKNKLLHHDRPVHDWYRFILSYPPHLVREYIGKFNLGPDDLLLDPFCGTGTTVVEAKLCKVPSLGLEANRFAQFGRSGQVERSLENLSELNATKSAV